MNPAPLPTGPQPFDFSGVGNCTVEWQKWLCSFELYALTCGLKNDTEKKNWLLYHAGAKVQNIYWNLSKVTDETAKGPLPNGYVQFRGNEYLDIVQKLQNFFKNHDVNYERYNFRKIFQEKNEPIDAFYLRLRLQADRCDFGTQKDENIKNQIVSGCSSQILRQKILERGDENIESLINFAKFLGDVTKQRKIFVSDSRQEVVKRNRSIVCSRCGLKGHKSKDDICPAKGSNCEYCGKLDHFARKCFTKKKENLKQPGNIKSKIFNEIESLKKDNKFITKKDVDHTTNGNDQTAKANGHTAKLNDHTTKANDRSMKSDVPADKIRTSKTNSLPNQLKEISSQQSMSVEIQIGKRKRTAPERFKDYSTNYKKKSFR